MVDLYKESPPRGATMALPGFHQSSTLPKAADIVRIFPLQVFELTLRPHVPRAGKGALSPTARLPYRAPLARARPSLRRTTGRSA